MAQSCAGHAQNFSSYSFLALYCTVHSHVLMLSSCITMSKAPRKSRRRNKYAPREDSFAQPLLNHVVQAESAIINGCQEYTGRGGYVN